MPIHPIWDSNSRLNSVQSLNSLAWHSRPFNLTPIYSPVSYPTPLVWTIYVLTIPEYSMFFKYTTLFIAGRFLLLLKVEATWYVYKGQAWLQLLSIGLTWGRMYWELWPYRLDSPLCQCGHYPDFDFVSHLRHQDFHLVHNTQFLSCISVEAQANFLCLTTPIWLLFYKWRN